MYKIITFTYLKNTLVNFYNKIIAKTDKKISASETTLSNKISSVESRVSNLESVKLTGVKLTQTEYNNLSNKDPNTLYIITE